MDTYEEIKDILSSLSCLDAYTFDKLLDLIDQYGSVCYSRGRRETRKEYSRILLGIRDDLFGLIDEEEV